MELTTIYALGSSILVSLIAVLGSIPFMLKKKISNRFLTILLSISVGTLLGSVFLQLLPEAASHKYTLKLPIYLMSGFLLFFVLEKFVHSRYEECKDKECHDNKHNLGLINIAGDGIHNFIDGLVIGSTYMISIPLGMAATVSIALHELPQEIADFGILLYAGFSRKKALFFNLLSAVTAMVGTVIGLLLSSKLTNFNSFILPFTAGVFLYIGASNLVPELHRRCSFAESIVDVAAIIVGFTIIALITIYGPGHVHR